MAWAALGSGRSLVGLVAAWWAAASTGVLMSTLVAVLGLVIGVLWGIGWSLIWDLTFRPSALVFLSPGLIMAALYFFTWRREHARPRT